jgi:hypothetical protein
MFPHYLINGRIVGKQSDSKEKVFQFYIHFLFSAEFRQMSAPQHKVPSLVLSYLMELEFSILEIHKISNFMKIRPAVSCGRTDRHDEAKSCFSQFLDRVLTVPITQC